jgi:hypothetical protein
MSKELKVRNAAYGSLKEVYFEGGGEVPAKLNGQYTSVPEAEKAIATYLGEKTNATKSSKRGNKEL